ncbi:unnamed protein product [Caenorhabditis auriculariae]|uniref:Uncharacterized protein n=1 Tax=Caenorhabditis auriculariae TaxID=2777116 RepID=A0A8S1HV01_9PELO|nr:unnamed protein product [Caenorhabditis auriculariae]
MNGRKRHLDDQSGSDTLELQRMMGALKQTLEGRLEEVGQVKDEMTYYSEDASVKRSKIHDIYQRRKKKVRSDYDAGLRCLNRGLYGPTRSTAAEERRKSVQEKYNRELERLVYWKDLELENWSFLGQIRRQNVHFHDNLRDHLSSLTTTLGYFLNDLHCDLEMKHSNQIVMSILNFLKRNEMTRIRLTEEHADRLNSLKVYCSDWQKRIEAGDITEKDIEPAFETFLIDLEKRLDLMKSDEAELKKLRISLEAFLEERKRLLIASFHQKSQAEKQPEIIFVEKVVKEEPGGEILSTEDPKERFCLRDRQRNRNHRIASFFFLEAILWQKDQKDDLQEILVRLASLSEDAKKFILGFSEVSKNPVDSSMLSSFASSCQDVWKIAEKECMPGNTIVDNFSNLRFSFQKISSLFYKASFNLAIRLYENRPVEESEKTFRGKKAELSFKESEIVSSAVTNCIDTYVTVHGKERFSYHRKMQMYVPSLFRLMNEVKNGLKEFGDEEVDEFL